MQFSYLARQWALPVVLTLTLSSAVSVFGSEPPEPAAPDVVIKYGAIATLDMSTVFKEYKQFHAEMKELTDDAKDFQAKLRTVEKTVLDLKRKKIGLEEDSPEAAKIDSDIEKLQESGRKAVSQKKKDLFKAEAELYDRLYQKVQAIVAQFARRHNIAVVIRSTSHEGNDRETVQQKVAQGVVYSANDITAEIIAALNQPE